MALKDNDRVSDAANNVTERNAWRESMRQKKIDLDHLLGQAAQDAQICPRLARKDK